MELTNVQISERLEAIPHEVYTASELYRTSLEAYETLKAGFEKDSAIAYQKAKARFISSKPTVKDLENIVTEKMHDERLKLIVEESGAKSHKNKITKLEMESRHIQSLVKLRCTEIERELYCERKKV